MLEAQLFRTILTRLRSIERRIDGSTFKGKLKEVDLKKRQGRIVIGRSNDGTEVLGPWASYSQIAGDLKLHSTPSVGQLMVMSGEGGDIEQGTLNSLQWTDENEDNHDSADEHRLTFGDVTIDLTGGGLFLTAGGVKFSFDGAGFVQTGGKQEHDGKNTGGDHDHNETGSVTEGPN